MKTSFLKCILSASLVLSSCSKDNEIPSINSSEPYSQDYISKIRREEIKREEQEKEREEKWNEDIDQLKQQLWDENLSDEQKEKLVSKIKNHEKANKFLKEAASSRSSAAYHRESAATNDYELGRKCSEKLALEEEKKALWYENEAQGVLAEN